MNACKRLANGGKEVPVNDDQMQMGAVSAFAARGHDDWMQEEFKTWVCMLCGFIYNEAEGLPAEGFPAGTRWRDIPDTWSCPDCGYAKLDFAMILAPSP